MQALKKIIRKAFGYIILFLLSWIAVHAIYSSGNWIVTNEYVLEHAGSFVVNYLFPFSVGFIIVLPTGIVLVWGIIKLYKD